MLVAFFFVCLVPLAAESVHYCEGSPCPDSAICYFGSCTPVLASASACDEKFFIPQSQYYVASGFPLQSSSFVYNDQVCSLAVPTTREKFDTMRGLVPGLGLPYNVIVGLAPLDVNGEQRWLVGDPQSPYYSVVFSTPQEMGTFNGPDGTLTFPNVWKGGNLNEAEGSGAAAIDARGKYLVGAAFFSIGYVMVSCPTACTTCLGDGLTCATCADGLLGPPACQTNVNECIAGTHTCLPSLESCVDTDGSFSCVSNLPEGIDMHVYNGHVYLSMAGSVTVELGDIFDELVALFPSLPGVTPYLPHVETFEEQLFLSSYFLGTVYALGLGNDRECFNCFRWTATQQPVSLNGAIISYQAFLYGVPPSNLDTFSGSLYYVYAQTDGSWFATSYSSLVVTQRILEFPYHNCATTSSARGLECATCSPGFSGPPECITDVNECSLGWDNCRWGSECVNTVGSFLCECERESCPIACGVLSSTSCETTVYTASGSSERGRLRVATKGVPGALVGLFLGLAFIALIIVFMSRVGRGPLYI